MMTFTTWMQNPQQPVHYFKCWTEDMFSTLTALESSNDPMYMMREALKIANSVLAQLPEELAVVCGPISSGKKSVEENLRIFDLTVIKLSDQMPIFNQMPFEPLFAKVHELIKGDTALCPDNKTSKFFIDHFYRAVFFSGKKWKAHFIYEWEYSTGAVIERDIFTTLKSDIVDLPEDFV